MTKGTTTVCSECNKGDVLERKKGRGGVKPGWYCYRCSGYVELVERERQAKGDGRSGMSKLLVELDASDVGGQSD